ncbi:hypothetical protein KIL84_008683 [Mauremys mutica]|uniref:Uncharacterized protein n=1 Tax=Mauremys mutica TaxID=74926 RepID=A0A9D3X886_9SAUR|nr:hypothetical protein KIL84_008683 [Mauremys mutica]
MGLRALSHLCSQQTERMCAAPEHCHGRWGAWEADHKVQQPRGCSSMCQGSRSALNNPITQGVQRWLKATLTTPCSPAPSTGTEELRLKPTTQPYRVRQRETRMHTS